MVNDKQIAVYGGIGKHADTHHIAVIDAAGRRLGDVQIPTTAAGYRAAVQFLGSWTRTSPRALTLDRGHGVGPTSGRQFA